MKPQILISLDVEDHDPRMVWSDISKADGPLLAAKLEQIALLLRDKARA